MRTIAIGDIHGCSTAFDSLLALVRPEANDRVILLGDIIDRGPNSRGVLEMVLALREQTQLTVLRGNHEEMLQRAQDGPLEFSLWLAVGGKETLTSYQWDGSDDWTQLIPQRHWDFVVEDLKDWCESDKFFFVHANVEPDLPLQEQTGEVLRWEVFSEQPRHCSGKRMICGHTAQKTGLPLCMPHGICLDTWVYGRGWLSALDVDNGQLFQANQRGETREMTLVDCE